MGMLFKAVQADIKRNVLLMRLRELRVTTTKQGVPIEKLSYADLKWELVMTSIRKEVCE